MKRRKGWPEWANWYAIDKPAGKDDGEADLHAAYLFLDKPEMHSGAKIWFHVVRGETKHERVRLSRWYDRFIYRFSLRAVK